MRNGRPVRYGGWAVAAWMAGVPLWSAGPARAELPPPLPPLITREAQQAIDKGLSYLARTQSRDGAWREGGQRNQYPVAMTALAGLALLADGNTATQGRYAPQVSRAATFLLGSARPDGLIARLEEASRCMHGHGFGMLFLGELYGMEDDRKKQERIGDVLRKAAGGLGHRDAIAGAPRVPQCGHRDSAFGSRP